MFLQLLPQVIEVLRHPKDKAESKFSNDTGISKEEEERYQKLISENEDLQKLIAQVFIGFLTFCSTLLVRKE